MSQLYSKVNSQGFIILSMFTTDPNASVALGERLLADSPPNPPDYTPGITKPMRVEPIPNSATEVPYLIVDEPNPVQPVVVAQVVDPFAGD